MGEPFVGEKEKRKQTNEYTPSCQSEELALQH